MIYPYTWAAKIVQFPHAWHWKYNTFFRYYVLAYAILTPTLFWSIHKVCKYIFKYQLILLTNYSAQWYCARLTGERSGFDSQCWQPEMGLGIIAHKQHKSAGEYTSSLTLEPMESRVILILKQVYCI